jgi:hypothetical protein
LFYRERNGAVRIGEAPSDAVPGRLLPLYEVRLDSTGDRDLEPHLGGRSKRPSAVRASFGEPADLLRIGEVHLPAAPCSRRASCSEARSPGIEITGQSRDSLIRRINSLMTRFNSLQGRNKFPVPMRRELARKPLNLMLDSEPVVAFGGPDEQNSLYFPS